MAAIRRAPDREGLGFQYEDEFDFGALFTGKGQLAMAISGSDTNGSQFFITQNPTRHLNLATIFGQLVRGFDVLTSLTNVSQRERCADNHDQHSRRRRSSRTSPTRL